MTKIRLLKTRTFYLTHIQWEECKSKPIDKGRIKGRAVEAMYDQTEMQLDQIREQIELLAKQAKNIHDRVNISEDIYLSDMSFEPLIGFTYHLYEKKDGKKSFVNGRA